MRTLVFCLAASLASPLAAFERMQQSQCVAAIQTMLEMAGESGDTEVIAGQIVTQDGFCLIEGRGAFDEAEFDYAEWRIEGAADWIRDGTPPLALELRVFGLDPDEMQGRIETDRPFLDFHTVLRQNPDENQLLIERLAFENDDGDVLAVSGVLDRVYLSSKAMLQVSLGSVALRGALLELTYSGKHENPFAFDLEAELRGNPQAQRDAAFRMMSVFPESVVNAASRAEFTEFAGTLPNPVGTLEVIFQSENGLGALQMGSFAYAAFSEVPEAEAIEQLLFGVTLQVDWSPAEGQTD